MSRNRYLLQLVETTVDSGRVFKCLLILPSLAADKLQHCRAFLGSHEQASNSQVELPQPREGACCDTASVPDVLALAGKGFQTCKAPAALSASCPQGWLWKLISPFCHEKQYNEKLTEPAFRLAK